MYATDIVVPIIRIGKNMTLLKTQAKKNSKNSSKEQSTT